MPEIRIEKPKTVAIVGVGGTGCTVASLLARSHIKLILIDRDIVEESNLDRQILYDMNNVGKPKVFVAKEKLEQFSDIEVRYEDLNRTTIDFLGVDLVIDCTDNNATRYLINDYCKKYRLPWIYTGAISAIGAIAFIHPESFCFRCFSDEKQGETCLEAGVMNAAVTLVGSIAAAKAMQFLVNGNTQSDLIRINVANNEVMHITVNKRSDCPCCRGVYEYLEGDRARSIVKVCDKGKYLMTLNKPINTLELAQRLKKYVPVQANEHAAHFGDMIVFSHGAVLVTAKNESEAKKKMDFIGI